MPDKTVFRDSNGQAVQRVLTATVGEHQLASDGVWAGINVESGDSGDVRAWVVDDGIYQWYVPDTLTVNDGDVVYLAIADITGNIPNDTAYSTSAGAGKIPLFKALEDKVTANGAGNHYATGKSLLNQQGG